MNILYCSIKAELHILEILVVYYWLSIIEIENCDQYSGCGQGKDSLHREKGMAPA